MSLLFFIWIITTFDLAGQYILILFCLFTMPKILLRTYLQDSYQTAQNHYLFWLAQMSSLLVFFLSSLIIFFARWFLLEDHDLFSKTNWALVIILSAMLVIFLAHIVIDCFQRAKIKVKVVNNKKITKIYQQILPEFKFLFKPRLKIIFDQQILATVGFFLPTIIIPRAIAELSNEQIRLILLHELIHIKRGHLWLRLGFVSFNQKIITKITQQSNSRMIGFCQKIDLEKDCDEALIKMLGKDKIKLYAQTLLTVKSLNLSPAVNCGFNASQDQLVVRVKHLKYLKHEQLKPPSIWLALILLIS